MWKSARIETHKILILENQAHVEQPNRSWPGPSFQCVFPSTFVLFAAAKATMRHVLFIMMAWDDLTSISKDVRIDRSHRFSFPLSKWSWNLIKRVFSLSGEKFRYFKFELGLDFGKTNWPVSPHFFQTQVSYYILLIIHRWKREFF